MKRNVTDWMQLIFSEFDEKTFKHLLVLLSVTALSIIIYAFIFSGFQIVDEFEHLHASWLVSIGKVPYHDFFEHHHPLLWFISAPIVYLFYDNVDIFYVMRGCSFIISTLTGIYIYKIVCFFASKNSAIFSILLYLANIITIYNYSQFRPDVYMNFCFILGLYYWFLYLNDKKLRFLMFSFIGFTLSFLFLQKIVFLLIAFEIIIFVYLLKRKISWSDVLKAVTPCILLILSVFLYLYQNNALIDYFNFNYRFNKAMLFYFSRGAFWFQNITFSFYSLALLTAICFYKKKGVYFRTITILYIIEFLQRAFYFSPHPNYYTLLAILAAIINSVWFEFLIKKNKIFLIVLFCFLGLRLNSLLNSVVHSSQNYNSYRDYQLADFAHKNSKSDDFIMNGYDKNYNIYRSDVNFYWFGLDMLMPIIEREFNLEHQIDVNNLILTHHPQFIFVKNYPDLMALRTYGEQKYSQIFMSGILDQYYKKTPFPYLMQHK